MKRIGGRGGETTAGMGRRQEGGLGVGDEGRRDREVGGVGGGGGG